MIGVAVAALAGIGFGLFQATNHRAGRHVDTYVATFGVLATSVVLLLVVALTTQDLSTLWAAPPRAYLWFAAAGGVHFFFGWTFLALSQQRLGASRTGVLVGTTPLFGATIAFLVLEETLHPVAIVGVALVVAGTIGLARARAPGGAVGGLTSSAPMFLGLGAAVCWGASPVFIRWGLADLASPLLGVTIGMVAATTLYALALTARRPPWRGAIARSTTGWLIAAGGLVALSITAQWVALSKVPVALVLALSQLSVPVVILVSPRFSSGRTEHLSAAGLTAGATILVGSLVIILARA